MWTKGIVCVLVTCFLVSSASESDFTMPKQCSWNNESDEKNETLTCEIETIDDVAKFVQNTKVSVTTLNLECNKSQFEKSTIEQKVVGSIPQLPKLKTIAISNCVIRNFALQIPKEVDPPKVPEDWGQNRLKLTKKLTFGKYPCPSIDTHFSSNVLRDLKNKAIFKRECLESVEVSNYSKDDLPTRSVDTQGVTNLHLSNNAILKIDEHAIDNLENLKVLNFSGNGIVALPQRFFSKTLRLDKIFLNNNSLSILVPGLFDGLRELTVLDLSRNLLTSQWIDIQTFSSLRMLMTLDLSFNNLSIITSLMFLGLGNLQYLNLEHNQITSLTELCFETLHSLRTLKLSNNKISKFEARHSVGLSTVSELRLESNHLSHIPEDAFVNFKNVQDLSLNENRFDDVPQGIRNLRNLRLLHLGDNRIRTIGGNSLQGLTELLGLRLYGNKLRNISKETFASLTSLEVLNLGSNAIQQIDRGSFENNRRLIAIRLDDNKISDVQGMFDKLQSLRILSISKNLLNEFDYDHVPRNLAWLDLSENLISDLKSSSKNHVLKTLNLSHNLVRKISSESFPDTVETIYLNDNRIEVVATGTFLQKTELQEVRLSSNSIKHLNLSALELKPFPTSKSLPMFYLGNNSLLCDCTMKWLPWMTMLSQLRQHPLVMDLDNITCEMVHAKSISTKPLLSTALEDFLCSYEEQCSPNCPCCHSDNCSCRKTCPKQCSCYHDYNWVNHVVDCSNAEHQFVPANIPHDVTHLYLDGNSIDEVENYAFSKLSNLQELFLNKSKIFALNEESFVGIESLKVLHLEHNALRELSEEYFSQLTELTELNLEHNLLENISHQSFKNQKKMAVLRLNNNSVVDFQPWHEIDNFDTKIFLEGNFWNCDCANIFALRDWLANHAENAADQMFCNDKPETVFQAILRCEKHSENILSTTKTFRFDALFAFLGFSFLVIVIIILGIRANRRDRRKLAVPCTEL